MSALRFGAIHFRYFGLLGRQSINAQWLYPAGDVFTDLFRTLGSIEHKSRNDFALIKFNHQVFGAMVTKQAVLIVAISPRLHAIFYTGSPGSAEGCINIILGSFAYADS